jgi:hypothetical protein
MNFQICSIIIIIMRGISDNMVSWIIQGQLIISVCSLEWIRGISHLFKRIILGDNDWDITIYFSLDIKGKLLIKKISTSAIVELKLMPGYIFWAIYTWDQSQAHLIVSFFSEFQYIWKLLLTFLNTFCEIEIVLP